MNALISSDIFVLKLSDATNPDGTWSYQDVLPNATKDRSDQFIQKVGECPWKLDGRRGCCLLECCIEPKALNGVEELER